MYTIENDDGIKTFMHPVKSAGISIHAGIIEASTNYVDYKVHVNQRHAPIWHLTPEYRKHPIFTVFRTPHEWYKSFYRFFVSVEGYLSWAMNDPREDQKIYPIDPNEFVHRMVNLKDTLTAFPNKARVFRNLLRSQGNLHFITSYFQGDFHPNYPASMDQFNFSLYDWFMKPMGSTSEVHYVPMRRLDVIEKNFGIKIPHKNKTQSDLNFEFNEETINLIKETHSRWYKMEEDYI